MNLKKIFIIFIVLMSLGLVSCSSSKKISFSHSIKIDSGVQNGQIKTNLTSAKEGETINVEYIPNSGYETIESSKVYNYMHHIKNDTFVMPNEAVILSARFENNTYNISVDAVGCEVNVPTEAKADQEVELRVSASSLAIFESLTYNETSLHLENGVAKFIMPRSDVTITAVYSADKNKREYTNLKYGSDKEETLDLYLPKEEPSALVLYIHGGFWMMGDKEEAKNHFLSNVEENNVALCSINYRTLEFSPSLSLSNSNFDTMTGDITQALIIVKNILELYGYSIDNLIVSGYSAGGQLSLLYSYKYKVECLEKTGFKINGVISLAGPINLKNYFDLLDDQDTFDSWVNSSYLNEVLNKYNIPSSMLNVNVVKKLLIRVFSTLTNVENKDKLSAEDLYQKLYEEYTPLYSPSSYVSKNCVNTLLMYSNKDEFIPFDQSTNFKDSLLSSGVDVTFSVLDGGNHSSFSIESSTPEYIAQVNTEVTNFIKNNK